MSVKRAVPAKHAVAKTIQKSELDNNLEKALKTIDRKLKQLTGVDPSNSQHPAPFVWRWGTNFKMNENDSNNINLTTCQDMGYLIKALAWMKRLKVDTENIMEELQYTAVTPVVWMGYTLDSWIEALQFRIRQIRYSAEIAQLQSAKAELVGLMSSEQKLFNALSKVEAILKD